MSIPSRGLNYNFKFSPKWSVGLHNDIIVEDFSVEEHHSKSTGGSTLPERSYPIAAAVVVSFNPLKHFIFLPGAGGGFEHTGNFVLVRTVEYGYHMNNNFELFANVVYDFKIDAYNPRAIGLCVAKIF